MNLKASMVRGFFGGAMLLIAQAVPAAAEKVTLGCSLGPGYVTFYITIDTVAKTVKENSNAYTGGPFPAQITDDAVTWHSHNMLSIYNRISARMTSGWNVLNGETHQMESVSCARAGPAPF